MAVRKLKSGRWIADVVVGRKVDGSPDRRSVTCDTKAKAKKAERALLLEKDRRHGGVSGRVTFREFVEEVYWPQKAGIRDNTRKGYERDLNLRLLPAFGDMDVDRIGRMSIQRMISSCPSRKVATNARETLSSVLSIAVELGMIPVNPAGFRYSYPKASDLPADHMGEWLTTFAAQRPLLEYVAAEHPGEPEERIVVLGLCEGLRKGEVFGLDWEDVDLSRAELSVRRTYTVGKGGAHLTDPKTPRARRTIPVYSYALSRMLAWGPGEGPVVTVQGRRMGPGTGSVRLRRMLERAAAEGVELPRVTVSSLRHSFATSCANAGMEPSRLSALMGHRDIATTQRYYVRQKLENLRSDAPVVDAALGL